MLSRHYVGVNGKRVINSWIDGIYYVGSDGKYLKNTITPDGYYVDKNGKYESDTSKFTGKLQGWVDGHYYKKGVMQKNCWIIIGDDKYYLDENGIVVKDKWVDDVYLSSDGKMLRYAMTPDGIFVNSDGKKVDLTKDLNNINYEKVEANAWYRTENGIWYYFEEDRYTRKKGWHIDPRDNQTYYLDLNTGIMAVGWKMIDGSYYYFSEQETSPNWYLNVSTKEWESKREIVKSYGSMYHDEYTPDGYYVGADGRLVQLKDINNLAGGNGYISFLNNYTDYITRNDDVKWQVVDNINGDTYVLSDKIIYCMPFGSNNNYDSSNIKAWLNNNFLNEYFSAEDRKKIKEIRIPTVEEIKKWFPDTIADIWGVAPCHNNAVCTGTQYAIAQGLSVYTKSNVWFYGCSQYWLKNSGTKANAVSNVYCRGIIDEGGELPTKADVGIRPLVILSSNTSSKNIKNTKNATNQTKQIEQLSENDFIVRGDNSVTRTTNDSSVITQHVGQDWWYTSFTDTDNIETARGLRLGDDISKVKELYGNIDIKYHEMTDLKDFLTELRKIKKDDTVGEGFEKLNAEDTFCEFKVNCDGKENCIRFYFDIKNKIKMILYYSNIPRPYFTKS